MLLGFDIKPVVLAQERERVDLAGQLEPDSGGRARLGDRNAAGFAAAVGTD